MATVTTNIYMKGASAPTLDKLAHVLERLARLSPTYRRLQELDRMPDTALSAQGVSRPDALRRIFGARFYA